MVRGINVVRDFTLEKYQQLCRALLDSGYTTLTVSEYLGRDFADSTSNGQKTVILRHDVDRKIINALRMAELEHALGIRSTYYFRHPSTFKPEIISAIRDLGHEIGYHYETLSKANGDHDKAIRLFEQELAAFRKIPECEIKTICMHGSPLSPYDNRDLWKRYDFKNFDIEGEAYLSMAGRDVQYLTDTGRNWCGKHSVRDVMPGTSATMPAVETTRGLIMWIRSSMEGNLYLTVHPERWALTNSEWVVGSITDIAVNIGKAAFHVTRK